MQLSPLVAQVHQQLTATAGLGDERTRQIADTLATAAAPAVRLAVLDALSAAADEITAALLDHPGSPAVSIHLDGAAGGDEVRIVVSDTAAAPVGAEPRSDDGDASARISLRLSESLKSDVEDAAGKDGVSVNTWLVRAASSALAPSPFAGLGGALGGFGARGSGPWGGGQGPWAGGGGGKNHITGWING